MELLRVDQATRSEKGKDLIAIKGFKFVFKKSLLRAWSDGAAQMKNVNAT
jgi:hypothetical protein